MKGKQLFRTVLLALMGLTIGLSVYRWNAKTLTGNQMPMPLGFGVSVVLSGSMEPALSVGDLVIVRAADTAQKGDIAVFQTGGSLVIHRVVEIYGDTLITQGDANNTADEPVPITALKGIMVCAIPYIGSGVQLLKQPVVVILLLLAAFGLTELSYRREKQKEEDELEALKAQIRQLAEEIREDS